MLLFWKLSTLCSLIFVVTPFSHLQNSENYYLFIFFLIFFFNVIF
jgi:hypothetical protein